MLQLQQLNYAIGERLLIRDAGWVINPGERIALIGPNGAGKTTLLRLINGELTPQSGRILKPRHFRIGYLPQEAIELNGASVLATVMQGKTDIVNIGKEIEDTEDRLQKTSDEQQQQQLLQHLDHLQHRFTILEGHQLESESKKILGGLGFAQSDFDRPLSELSGGWQMRVFLARLLLQEPDLLLLDEPTNHLDLESLEWMEDYLRHFNGSIVFVSHDRFFIDRLALKLVELFNGQLRQYSGNYRTYEQQRKEEEERLIKQWEEQQAERQRLQRFIDRFRYKASKAAQVQSRIKQLEKMETITLPESRSHLQFKIKAHHPGYKEVLHIRHLYFRYDADWVLNDINLDFYRGQKIALVGPNGAGKTTLTRLMFGELKPQEGTLTLGQRVEPAYYAQHQVDALNPDATVHEEVASTAAPSFEGKVRDILGVFQFSGDDINKQIRVLSGGEKARVSLAKILLSPCNFLIMDEPTNHLDLTSREALEEALRDYDGTLLIISHDRYFLDKLVQRVIELKDGRLRLFEGNYSAYLSKRSAESEEKPIDRTKESDTTAKSGGKKNKEQKQQEAQLRQQFSQERNALGTRITELEEKIETLEQQKNDLEQALADPETYNQPEQAAEMQIEYDRIINELPELEEQWENAQLRLEEILQHIQTAISKK